MQTAAITSDIAAFQQAVLEYYDAHGRHELPWRQGGPDGSFDPYKIMVSELMLQQTQVGRVIPKFLAFTENFPTLQRLAEAPLSDVLVMWSGLGYNRRAKFLKQAAETVMQEFDGRMPRSREKLVRLPGVGSNTAGAILTYAFNQPEIFIETNVRTVYFRHFFNDRTGIPDKELEPIVRATVLQHDPRTWYWALMDYGTHLKQTIGNLSRASSHYAKQSTFAGSRRQIRGQVLRLLAKAPHPAMLLRETIPDARLEGVLIDLLKEGFIEENDSRYQLRA